MLRLSNIILNDMCGYMHIRTPSRYSRSNKSKFMLEMADKVTDNMCITLKFNNLFCNVSKIPPMAS